MSRRLYCLHTTHSYRLNWYLQVGHNDGAMILYKRSVWDAFTTHCIASNSLQYYQNIPWKNTLKEIFPHEPPQSYIFGGNVIEEATELSWRRKAYYKHTQHVLTYWSRVLRFFSRYLWIYTYFVWNAKAIQWRIIHIWLQFCLCLLTTYSPELLYIPL